MENKVGQMVTKRTEFPEMIGYGQGYSPERTILSLGAGMIVFPVMREKERGDIFNLPDVWIFNDNWLIIPDKLVA